MRTSIAAVVVLAAVSAAAVAVPVAAPETAAYYRIELSPSGSYVAIGAPANKGNMVVFHAYPDGKLMSLRKADVRKVSSITAQEAAALAGKDLVSIGNLAMQGGSAPAAGSPGAGTAAHSSPAVPAYASHAMTGP